MKRFLLTLLLALSFGIGAAWAESFKIEFQTRVDNNGGKAVTSSSKPADVVASGAEFLSSFPTCTNVTDAGIGGMRIGTNKGTGKITFNFSEKAKVKPSKIVITVSGNNNVTFKFNGDATETVSASKLSTAKDNYVVYELKKLPETLETLIVEKTSSNIGYLKSIYVEEAVSGPVEVEDLTLSPLEFDVNDEKTLTVNPEDFVSGVTGLSFTSDENVAYFAQGENNTIEAKALSAGETDLTLSWSDGGKYLAGTKTFKVKVNALKPTLSYSAATCEVVLEEEPYDFPVLTADTKGLNVVYSSSNEEVAMIDENGVIGLMNVAGTTNITAKIEAVPGKNEGAEASFELTVKPAGSLAAPVFEPESGTYEVTEVVSISGPAGATIYYGVGTTKADATDVYTEEFMLETLGEFTYVAYAKKDDRESDIVTVTYNVVKETAVFEFNATAGETAMGSLLDIDTLLNNPKALEYTLSTDNAEVARVAIKDPKHIWLMGAGVVNITATPVETESHSATATTYVLSVKEELGESVSDTATFDFATNNYGMKLQSGSEATYNETGLPNGNFICNEGVVTLTTAKLRGVGTRLWNHKEGHEFRIAKNSRITLSVPDGFLITNVEFTKGPGGDFGCTETSNSTTWSNTKGVNSVYFTASSGARMDISSIKITYSKPGEPAHCYANLSMGDEREALIDATTIVDAATVENDATALVEYVVLDENGAVSEEVKAVAIDGKLEITTIGDNEGDYTIRAYIDPYKEANAKYYAQVVEVPLLVRSMITPAELYIHGHFYNRYYDLTNPVKMEKNGRVFTATDVLIGGNEEHADDKFDFVFSSHKLDLAEAPEQSMMRAAAAAGSHQWAALTEGYVYHAASGNALIVTPASEITEAAHITPIYDGDDAKGKAGIYQFSVDFSNAAMPTYVAEYTGDITTGVEGIVVDNDAEAVYYDLTGRRVLNPSAGVVIRVQGGKAEKIMIK